ncbi:FAD-dependent pyridine nucleotide-disulphide oxidoreductase [Gloeothece citriformis PCC 7424]|uniref:FAD-dependent pyridine nucleotide-disulphide oxidoreductase n=1 Tax=Gloeothece citriformis (strain PCC 7424) TaxID=65393 RepID=B7KAB2_GLOC7|nr:NAD(P)/FAD-dependent oxidoreductase [Gloeothece citriformis]ACK72886.1 FAD-dependent pyridine nucleotide-disulphide oxidoreductase [Gloeothece citriformis PCC 7424]
MTKDYYQIVILGGGFGGLYTALYLSRHRLFQSGKCKITLVEPKDHFLFTPLLYELITGELQRWEIAPSYQKLLASTPIRLCQHSVKEINFKTRQVYLENAQQLSYDYLVVAVGTETRWADISGLSTYALTFRTLEDLEYLKGQLHLLEISDRQILRLGVIGGGANGVELACKLADRLGKRGEVILIERGKNILKGFSPGVRSAAWKALSLRRVNVELNATVEAIEANQMTLVQYDQRNQYPIDLVIWATGTQSREWVTDLDCQHNHQGKLLTYPTLQLIDYPEVFALGDITEIHSSSQKSVPATAQAAFQQASCAAKNIVALIQHKPLKVFHYHHLGDMLTLGQKSAIISSFFLNIDGRLGDIIRRLAYILRLPTPRHRLQVLRSWFIKLIIRVKRLFRWRITQLLQFISVR